MIEDLKIVRAELQANNRLKTALERLSRERELTLYRSGASQTDTVEAVKRAYAALQVNTFFQELLKE